MNESVPPVALAALNYRMGGQLSSLMALADGLQAVGVDARVLLPDVVLSNDRFLDGTRLRAPVVQVWPRSPEHRDALLRPGMDQVEGGVEGGKAARAAYFANCYHQPCDEFDDIVVWLSPHVLIDEVTEALVGDGKLGLSSVSWEKPKKS